MRKTVYKTEIIHLEVEVCDVGLFLHFTTTKWNRSVYKECIELISELLLSLKKKNIHDIYAAVPEGNTKLMKFAGMFGFNPIVLCKESNIYLMHQEVT